MLSLNAFEEVDQYSVRRCSLWGPQYKSRLTAMSYPK